MSISIRVDARGLIANLSALEQQQLPFAISLAINRTGLDFQAAERRHFADVFTLRRPSFIEREGVKRLGPAASKRNRSVTFGVSSRADFLDKFEPGGVKTARGGGFLSLPVDARRNKRDVITTANRPKALLTRLGRRAGAGGVFKLDQQRGKLGPGIYQRTGRGGRSVRELFAFERKAKTPRLLSFTSTFKQTVESRFSTNFATAFAEAVRTAR